MSQRSVTIIESHPMDDVSVAVVIDAKAPLVTPLPMEFPVTIFLQNGEKLEALASPIKASAKNGTCLILEDFDNQKEIPEGSKLILPNGF
ncbi:MAG: hypothetical protein HWE25_16685 [Alphaproteobacteria bacterium]|nr:hypothetical protein [Alphaproteobacteria bacterium]